MSTYYLKISDAKKRLKENMSYLENNVENFKTQLHLMSPYDLKDYFEDLDNIFDCLCGSVPNHNKTQYVAETPCLNSILTKINDITMILKSYESLLEENHNAIFICKINDRLERCLFYNRGLKDRIFKISMLKAAFNQRDINNKNNTNKNFNQTTENNTFKE